MKKKSVQEDYFRFESLGPGYKGLKFFRAWWCVDGVTGMFHASGNGDEVMKEYLRLWRRYEANRVNKPDS